MYQIGDRVVYGIHGVCCVVDQEERVVDRKRVTYLALEPVGQDGSRYLVPTHNAAAMAKLRKMLSREELEDLLNSETIRSDGWIKDENQRKQTYRELISSGNLVKLMQMVHTLYRHKAPRLPQDERSIFVTIISCGMRKNCLPAKQQLLWAWNTTRRRNT